MSNVHLLTNPWMSMFGIKTCDIRPQHQSSSEEDTTCTVCLERQAQDAAETVTLCARRLAEIARGEDHIDVGA